MESFRTCGATAVLITLLAAGPARAAAVAPQAQTAVEIHGLTIEAAWARATPPGATVGAGYLRIVNTGKTADRLIGISSPLAARVALHRTLVTGTITRMRPVMGGLAIPAGGTVTLQPGSYHLMFEGLKTPFKKGGHVDATLDFQKAGKVEVTFAVGGIGAGAPPQMPMR